MAPTASQGGSSTSARPPSPSSPRSAKAWRTSRSPGEEAPGTGPGRRLTPSALRALAARHGIRPKKSLGQHFLIEPALARRIAEIAGAGPGVKVLEIGAGLGSLTVALADAGATVVAVEFDRRLLPALEEMVGAMPSVDVVQADALTADWGSLLSGPGPWLAAANLPYNVGVPIIMRILESEPRIERLVVMVQREVGERLTAGPGGPEYGALSVRMAYRAQAIRVRKVSRSVFWPEPNVDSVVVSITRRPPPVEVDESALLELVRVAFEQRRKGMRAALVRLGLSGEDARSVLAGCGIEPSTRPERLGLPEFACLVEGWLARRATR